MTVPAGTDWALGVHARSQALLSTGSAAEGHYREAIDLLGRAGVHGELARAHLLYGGWLRRERHRRTAREQLRTAYGSFTEMGMDAFARGAAVHQPAHRRVAPAQDVREARHHLAETAPAQRRAMTAARRAGPAGARRRPGRWPGEGR
ncbi:hypothetical protein ACQEU6_30000 [Spirillospora sp. CA-108201]